MLAGVRVEPGGRVLQDIGLVNATDLAGGFLAWARDGLPCQPGTAVSL